MSATYRNIFSLLQHFCTRHPAPPIHPIRLETFVTCSQNSPTLNYFKPPSSRGGHKHQLSKSWCPMRRTCPTTLLVVHTLVHALTYIPPYRQEQHQEAQLLHPAPASCWQRHTLLISVLKTVVISLNINLQDRILTFLPFHMFCLSNMTAVTWKHYQQGN